jgi:hypothetical protein
VAISKRVKPEKEYAPGDRVLVKIGSRGPLPFTILRLVKRTQLMYCVDWAEHGYSSVLNTVPICSAAILEFVVS